MYHFSLIFSRQVNVTEESAWGDEEPMYYNEGAEIDNIRQQEQDSSNSQLPPPIPPLPDHYSAKPSNLPVAAEGFQSSEPLPASPLYENTAKTEDNTYSLAGEIHDPNSPKHEPWFHGKLSRHAVSLV